MLRENPKIRGRPIAYPAMVPLPGLPVRGSALGGAQLSLTSDLDALEAEYRRFEAIADCTPFQTFDWLASWQRHIGARTGTRPAVVTAAQRDGGLLFILPLAIERSGLARRLVFLGRDLCDYNAPLLAPNLHALIRETEFPIWWAAIEDLLSNTRGYAYDLVLLDKMPERVGRQANPLIGLPTTLHSAAAYRATLTGEWDSFYAQKRPPDRRRRDRARRKKLAELGELQFVVAKDERETFDTLAQLFLLKSRQFGRMGVFDPFAQPGCAEFFREVSMSPGRMVHVSRLDVGSRCAAATFGLMFRGCFYQFVVSYDDEFSRFGPGTAQLQECIRYAISEGMHLYDFTIGDEPFKLEWSDEKLVLHDHVASAGLLGHLSAARAMLATRAKRFIKQSPRLRLMVLRVRSVPNKILSRYSERRRFAQSFDGK